MPLSPHHRRIAKEPDWHAECLVTGTRLPHRVRRWLLDDGSLTERLSQLGDFSVRRLYQGWQVPLLSERILLQQDLRQRALVREVVLLLNRQPVVFARSVFPVASLTGSLGHLRRLHNSSLGAILFRHPGMHRSPFELARLQGDSDYLPTSLHQGQAAWGRRSRFEIEGKALMVSEVFLQAFRPWPTVLPVHRGQRGRVSAAIDRPKH